MNSENKINLNEIGYALRYFTAAFFGLGMFMSGVLSAQDFEISAEIRPRYELRNGYMQLIPENVDPASFVSQRTRLNIRYHKPGLDLYVSAQNVSVWGDVPTLATQDVNGVMMHEAWGRFHLSPGFSFKAGRQEINLDNERIFGAVGWAQQARSHDALVGIIQASPKHKIQFGYGLAAAGQSLTRINSVTAEYKNMQFVHYNAKFSPEAELSVLFLNLGITPDGTKEGLKFNQTLGFRFVTGNKLKADMAYYHQTGKVFGHEIHAHYVAGRLDYHFVDEFSFGVGAEYLSGTNSEQAYENKSGNFIPWFGTNHKFNGHMDYFYVGNMGYIDGLFDLYADINYDNNKFSLNFSPHAFKTAVKEENSLVASNRTYGYELDFSIGYRILEDVRIQAGYSQMLSSDGIQDRQLLLNPKDFQNWAWIMLTINPTLFKSVAQQPAE